MHRVTGIGAVFAIGRERRDTLVEDRLEFIEASGVRHDGLLSSRVLSTLAKLVSLDNLGPLVKPKLELLDRASVFNGTSHV